MTPEQRMSHLLSLYAVLNRVQAQIATLETMIENDLDRPRRPVAVCGTDGGYYRHLRRLKEPACDACRRAHALADRRRARKRQGAA